MNLYKYLQYLIVNINNGYIFTNQLVKSQEKIKS